MKMFSKLHASMVWRRGVSAAVLGLACAGLAHAQTTGARASGFVNPEGAAPARQAAMDLPPVYRGAAEDTLATVRQRGVLKVGVVPVQPMVMMDDKGELSGYSIDLARRLANDLGVDVQFVPTSWPNVVPDLIGRHFDVIAAGLWVTMPRALVVNFTQPTAAEGIHLVSNQKTTAQWSRVSDFNRPDVRIAVDAGTVQAQLAKRQFPRAQIVTDTPNPLEAVQKGLAHATLLPTLAPSVVLELGQGQLRLPLGQPLASTQAAMAIRKGDADFLNLLNTWLSLQREDGWLDERAFFWSTGGTSAR
jgi:polar amino acid transport system substrate-binding protein